METHVAHPDAYALERQHRPPLQYPLKQELLLLQEDPPESEPPELPDVLLPLFLYTQLPELEVG